MKNKLPTILLSLSLTTLFGFLNIGEDIELDSYLNARTSPEFWSYNRNIKTTLNKGTTGKVEEIKRFSSGNSGIKMKITSGPKAGETYWVHYNADRPAIKLVDVKNKKEVTPDLLTMAKDSVAKYFKTPEAPPAVKIPMRVPSANPVAKEVIKEPIKSEPVKEIAAKEVTKENPAPTPTPDLPPVAPTEAPSDSKIGFSEASFEDLKSKMIEEEIRAEVLRDIDASRDMEEHALKQTALEAAKTNASTILEAVTPENTDCVTGDQNVAERVGVYTPQEALSDLNSEPLKFMGNDLMPGSSLYDSCVFENSKVYVVYDYCTDDKVELKEASSTRVISKSGGSVKFSVGNHTKEPISKMERADYKGTWSVSYSPTKATGKLNMSSIKDFIKEDSNSNQGCFVGRSFGAQDISTKNVCFGEVASKGNEWASKAESFWFTPTKDWYGTQTLMRGLVQQAPMVKHSSAEKEKELKLRSK